MSCTLNKYQSLLMCFFLPRKAWQANQQMYRKLLYVEIASFVREYHDYQVVSQPSVGKVLLLQTEPTNIKDNN